MQHSTDLKQFDTKAFSRRVQKPWGWELHWTPAELPYAGKILHLNAGARCSLQIHDEKRESWLLLRGHAKVLWEDNDGRLIETDLESGNGYSCAVGQRHRLIGVTDCEVIEGSTPEAGTTWRLEDDYARPHETPQQRLVERQHPVA